MYLLIFLLLLPHAVPHAEFGQIPEEPYAELPRKITEEENEMLKANCGAHFLGKSRTVSKAMPGNGVPENVYPWIASLTFNSNGHFYDCTAVQISNRHILTAAHCVVSFKPKKEIDKICEAVRSFERGHRMGNQATPEELVRQTYDEIPPEKFTIRVSSSCKHLKKCNNDRIRFIVTKPPRVHEEYNPCLHENDLAIIELDENIPSDVGTPICMIEEDGNLMPKLTAIGYGRDPIANNNMHGSDVLEEIQFDSNDVTESTSKLDAVLFEKTLCPGDSGGPLVQMNRENRFSVVGIASAISPDCDVTFTEEHKRTTRFMNVRGYTEWICINTGICPIKKMGSYADYTDSPSKWIRSFKFGRH